MKHKNPEPTRAYAHELCSQLWLLEPERLERIRNDIDQASEEKIPGLCKVLGGALTQQNDFLRKVIQADPQFPGTLGAFLREKFLGLQKESDSDEKTLLGSITKELDQ